VESGKLKSDAVSAFIPCPAGNPDDILLPEKNQYF
jgi:hypothetical protein